MKPKTREDVESSVFSDDLVEIRSTFDRISRGEVQINAPQIDPQIITRLAMQGSDYEDIAIALGVKESWLKKNFGREVELGKVQMRQTLRKWQLKSARDGNVSMLIHLGKHHLGQKEKIEQEITVKPMPFVVIDNMGFAENFDSRSEMEDIMRTIVIESNE